MLTGICIVNDIVVPIFNLPAFIRFYYETIISLIRIEKFLCYKESDNKQIEYLPKNSEYSIIIEDTDFGVEKLIEEKKRKNSEDEKANLKVIIYNNDIDNERKNENKMYENGKQYQEKGIIQLLQNITFKVKKGEHVGIIGEVGSGKTCLLNSIINNLAVLNKENMTGNIKLSGKISFVSQNAWILNDTIEQNILFFKPMNKHKYNKIIKICQLEQDLLIFPLGDQTEIGEKGVNLSGGQKARLAIARAIYNDSDIYIFDDPLSSLDAYVGMNLFNEVINDYLKEKTVIISTHALQYVSNFDKVFYMHQGMIKFEGGPDEIEKEKFYIEFKSIENNKTKVESEINKEKEEIKKK